MRRLQAWIAGLLFLAGSLLGAAAPFDPDRDVAVAYQDGSVVLTVPPGAHLKSAFLTVALKPGTPGTLRAGPLPPTDAKDELGDGIWHGRVAVPVSGTGLPAEVELVVTYQPCTEGAGGVCYPPRDRILKVQGAALAAGAGPGPVPGRPARGLRGLVLLYLAALGFGLAASLTPCVYPMIAITMAVLGAKGGGKARGLALSAALVLGMAATYTALGVAAALTGSAFGAFAQSRAFLIPVSLLFALFALSLFGAFEVSLPQGLQSRLQGSGPRRGLGGAFVMGLVLGPISAPCVGPFIGTALVAIAQQGRVLLGASLLFTFALGMGILFMAVGTFSAALPRSGDWLVRLKQAMGLVVLGFAAWNVRLVVPGLAELRFLEPHPAGGGRGGGGVPPGRGPALGAGQGRGPGGPDPGRAAGRPGGGAQAGPEPAPVRRGPGPGSRARPGRVAPAGPGDRPGPGQGLRQAGTGGRVRRVVRRVQGTGHQDLARPPGGRLGPGPGGGGAHRHLRGARGPGQAPGPVPRGRSLFPSGSSSSMAPTSFSSPKNAKPFQRVPVISPAIALSEVNRRPSYSNLSSRTLTTTVWSLYCFTIKLPGIGSRASRV